MHSDSLNCAFRFFTGHSKNADGSVQFVRGKTSIGKTIDGVIKIFTAAVSVFSVSLLYVCFLFLD